MDKYNLKNLERYIEKPWIPFEVARVNNQVLRVAIFEGEYHWHSHENKDEFFLVYKGSIKKKSIVLMIEPETFKSERD